MCGGWGPRVNHAVVQASHELLVRNIERAAAEGVMELFVDVEESMVCTCAQHVSKK